MRPKFEIYNDAKGQFRFRLRAANNEIIAVSEGYTTKTACLSGVESVKESAPSAIIEDQISFESFEKRVLKVLGRFNRLEGNEIKNLTNLNPEEINDVIDYLEKLGAVKVKGKNPPFNFSNVSITKDGMQLYNRKFLDNASF